MERPRNPGYCLPSGWRAREVAPAQTRCDECVAGCLMPTIGSSSRASLEGPMTNRARVCGPTYPSMPTAVSATGNTCLSRSARPRPRHEIGSPVATAAVR